MVHDVLIIGGGAAGMQAAISLSELGVKSLLLERDERLGGRLNQWYKLAPTLTLSQDVADQLREKVAGGDIEVRTSSEVSSIEGGCVVLRSGEKIAARAIIISTGANVFDATIKEEYGYGIYDNVITTADLEQRLKEGSLKTKQGVVPKRVAFLHCVGSRDAKVCQEHCSRLCCITAVKQAIEVKEMLPTAEVYNFYMDIRMFGPLYEEIYRQAQEEFNIHFVRGRVSEASETFDQRIQIKSEDTLLGRPLKMTFDMLVLAVGMTARESNHSFAENIPAINLYKSGFIKPHDLYYNNVCSDAKDLFYAGTVTAPKSVGEALNEGAAVALKVSQHLKLAK